jgi:hypothetical protein
MDIPKSRLGILEFTESILGIHPYQWQPPALLKFAANKRDAGRREKNKAVLAGLLAFIGSYTVSEADQVLTLQVEASTFPNWGGTNQKRSLTLIGDGMK